ncbi:membrane protein [Actinocatenispora sera]|uniref:Membrane protein n=1 Tax=Actinocatenispora sera TaxID=390989 RepID=A0A810L014_9ACTN|nr:membrane protein [Actinocatenispora sera]BCJ28537.1 membrane protein [Actinocatenispora sera]
MPTSIDTSIDTGAQIDVASGSTGLRNLYYVRFGFAIVWAGLVVLVASTLNPASIGLLVIYPLFDAAAAVIDFRTSGTSRPRTPLYLNMALSFLTFLGLAAAATSGIPSVLTVWGAWAITAGIVQLVVAILRRRLGGQWAMILSGAISVVAGASFVLQAGGKASSLTNIAGYATLGGIFFLVSAIRLHRRATLRK